MPAPSDDVRDVLIVGAGLRGAMIAQRLAALGLRITLVDRGDVGAHASRALVCWPVGLEDVDVAAARARASELGWLTAAAPHLVRRVGGFVAMAGAWRPRRTLLRLDVHDATAGPPAAHAELALEPDLFGGAQQGLRLDATSVDERRLALALVLWARERDTEVRLGARIEKQIEGGVELEGGEVLRARVVIDATGGSRPAHHVTELLISPRSERALSDRAVVDGQDVLLEHVPLEGRALVRTVSPRPVAPDALTAWLGDEALDVHQARRTSGPLHVEADGPGRFVLYGSGPPWRPALRALTAALARELGRPLDAHAGEDALFEDGELDVTPQLQRAGLGVPILAALVARHGQRAQAICERVLRTPREGAIVCACATVIEAELRHAASHELAFDLASVCRRTELGVGPCAGVRCSVRAAQIARAAPLALVELRRDGSALKKPRAALLEELALGTQMALGDRKTDAGAVE